MTQLYEHIQDVMVKLCSSLCSLISSSIKRYTFLEHCRLFHRVHSGI